MNGAISETTRSATALAKRFRLLQSSFADDLPEVRQRVLDEELELVLRTVPISKRKECLEALAAEFPVPGQVEMPGVGGQKTSPPSLPDDPAFVVDHLLNLLRSMSPEQIADVANQLQNSGLLPAGAPARVDVPPELHNRIEKLAPNRVLDNTRALRALDILMEFELNLDQLVWQVWKSIAGRSVIHHETGTYREFRTTLAAYLTGDSEVSTEQIKQIVNKTRKLVSGLMAAMGTVGEIHAAKFLDRLSPEAIRKAAEADTSVFESMEKKCWRRYNAIFAEMNREAIEKEILEAIRKYTEKLVLGAEVVSTLED
jgi:hypothetical protein